MKFKQIIIDPSIKDLSISKSVKENFQIGYSPKLSDYRAGKRVLYLSPKKGEIFHICASLDPKYICCSTHVISHISNCPFECTYCFLQNYLTDTTLTLIADTKAILHEIQSKTSKQPWRLFRIGSWELGDSLGIHPLNLAAKELIERFKRLKNCILKLRTKSAQVDPLLDVDHGNKTVISWTVNPQEVIKKEEIGTANIDERIRAMEKVVKAGYKIGLHFDPMLLFKNWETAYERLIKDIFSAISPNDVIWISIGSLRFNPEMKTKIENNYPSSKITAQEMILGDDNKFRYLRPVRVKMYKHLLELLSQNGASKCFTYLCMERWNVWQEVFGRYPKSIGHLDYLIAKSIWKRFPQIYNMPLAPDKEKYLALTYS